MLCLAHAEYDEAFDLTEEKADLNSLRKQRINEHITRPFQYLYLKSTTII